MPLDVPTDMGRSKKLSALWIGYLGWVLATATIVFLKKLGYSDIATHQIGIFIAGATLAHGLGLAMVHLGWDTRFRFDPHFVLIPNWFFFAPVAAYGFYAVGTARDLMLIGWLMGLFFLAGHVRFRCVLLTACYYMFLYLVLLVVMSRLHGHAPNYLRELVRIGAFLTVCIFLAVLLDRFASQKTHLKESIGQLREKDREIMKLNERLALFVSDPLVKHLSKDEGRTLFEHRRKKITVFFSDICRFSTITDTMEPEETAEQLNEYFREMIPLVLHHKGTLDKLMGDGMMVLFGAPDDMDPAEGAYRCLQMATAMRDKLRALNHRWSQKGYPHALRVRMGVHTGLSVVGTFGSKHWIHYTAIGSQVNVAARLQQIAEPDQILISRATYTLVAEKVQARDLGVMPLKGLHQPVHVYECVDLHADQQPQRILDEGPGYFVWVQWNTTDPSTLKALAHRLASLAETKKESEK
ncbi:adenylate/guanylate cyclase domain-containing protein [Desulfosoma caldarium]|uniref:Class 3 adenylate cyclase n=1 Tax=Desulfosoma caldarium TaxID=610254 RepID=A0A3N1USW4_9BACT|nr:adenylate/guanylate cyclase domain-containing protein [Desulfosoma caldarium]ROQ93233.1 class 3 adenylate cyclase [Desulfosoma caldarium]